MLKYREYTLSHPKIIIRIVISFRLFCTLFILLSCLPALQQSIHMFKFFFFHFFADYPHTRVFVYLVFLMENRLRIMKNAHELTFSFAFILLYRYMFLYNTVYHYIILYRSIYILVIRVILLQHCIGN